MKENGNVDREVARVARHQDGLVTRAQAIAAGASPRIIEHRLELGLWIRDGAGLYRMAGVPVTWPQRVRAACLIAAPGAVASHRTAAALYLVSGIRPGRIEITVAEGGSARNPLARVHRSKFLERADCGRVGGIPVTRPARAMIDSAGQMSPETLEEGVDDILCRRLATLSEFWARLDQLGARRGSRAMRTVLEAWDGGALPANRAEMSIVRMLRANGLPSPVRQHSVYESGRFLGRVDLAWPAARLAMELDSFRWHAGRRPFRSDRKRRNRLEAAGWRVLNATTDDIADGSVLVSAAAALLRASGKAPAA